MNFADRSLPAVAQKKLMPEGPEIKLAADKIAKDIVDRSLTEVSFAFDRLKSFEAKLTAARIVSVTPKGKTLLTRFSNQLTIYSHNQLYGVWYSRRAYDYSATKGITNSLAIVAQLKQRGQTRRQ